MTLLNPLVLEKKKGFLDSEESIGRARRSLEKTTEKDYERYDEAKMISQVKAHEKVLD